MRHYGGVTRDIAVISMFNEGKTYLEIADRLGTSRNAIAGVCHRLGLRRNQPEGISPEERAEREQDHRDLDMLADVREGHTVRDTARHWGVTPSHIERLKKSVKEAA